MNSITTGFFQANAALAEGENRLPRFRAPQHDTNVYAMDGVPRRYTHLMGLDCGMRVLPYTMQEKYSRNRKPTDIPAIFMENEHLKATFLPTLGGRLISLIRKEDGRELVYCNTSLQMANLANRNAWFAGGIEWNIGQYGHAFTSSTDVFASTQTGSDGEQFLRLYEYERCKDLWWQIDFHLPQGSRFLSATVQVTNLASKRNSLYYWTNTAVEMTEATRVFASNDHAMYLDPYTPASFKRYGYMQLPDIELYPEIDASYPQRFPYSEEYFFTCDGDPMPWETAIEADGQGFFEASTHPLSYRKMFCWGHGDGGRHWQRFLAPGLGKEYVEIQSGLAASQLHGMFIEAGQSVAWTQVFGSLSTDPKLSQSPDYTVAKTEVQQCVDQIITSDDVMKIHEICSNDLVVPPQDIIHTGSGWGWIEKSLQQIQPADSLRFEADSITEEQKPWAIALETGMLPDSDDPFSYACVVGKRWIEFLEQAIKEQRTPRAKAILRHYLGIALLEDEQVAYARQVWMDAFASVPNPWTARNLAMLEIRRGMPKEGLRWYAKGLKGITCPYLPMAEEYARLLVEQSMFDEARSFMDSLPKGYIGDSDYLAISRAQVAAHDGDMALLETLVVNRELANVREGDLVLTRLWEAYSMLKHGKILPTPENLDFNMFSVEQMQKIASMTN